MNQVLLIPGLGGSGIDHWQSQWRNDRPGCRWVLGVDWNLPDKALWLDGLDLAIQACDEPPLLVAHSIGCALVVNWALNHQSTPITGALLVAPPDLDTPYKVPAEATCFAPMPLKPLPFRSTVVTSTNDHYIDEPKAQQFASAWGADLVNIGAHGHINADSHLGVWNEGWGLLQDLLKTSDSSRVLKA